MRSPAKLQVHDGVAVWSGGADVADIDVWFLHAFADSHLCFREAYAHPGPMLYPETHRESSMRNDERLLIGELAQHTGVNRETLRYYERIGLLRPARRTAAGYRVYDRESAARLFFIKGAQTFGFSLEEIRDLLELKPESPRSCSRVMSMLDRKIEHLAAHIRQTRRFHRQLKRYRKHCVEALGAGDPCPVILKVSRPRDAERV